MERLYVPDLDTLSDTNSKSLSEQDIMNSFENFENYWNSKFFQELKINTTCFLLRNCINYEEKIKCLLQGAFAEPADSKLDSSDLYIKNLITKNTFVESKISLELIELFFELTKNKFSII